MQTDAHVSATPLTLVIPAYNRASLIWATVNSALHQTKPFTEIIVVDDGSTDATAMVLQPFGDRIRVITTQNQGVQAARNTGVAAARTPYVCLCDSDDLLEPDFVEVTSAWLARRPDIDIVYMNFRPFDSEAIYADKFASAPADWFEGSQVDGDFRTDIPDLYMRTLRYQPLFPTGATFKQQFYQTIHGFDPRFNHVGAEDWEFTLRAIAAGRTGVCMRPLARVRKHDGNDSGNTTRQLLGEALILEHALVDHAPAMAHADTVQANVVRRRLDALSSAFADGDFDTFQAIDRQLPDDLEDRKLQAKKLIASMPAGLRNVAWRLTQAGTR